MAPILEQVILSGDRHWKNPVAVLKLIEKHPNALWHVGDCPSGLDEMARSMMVALGIPHVRYLADWDGYRPTKPGRKNPAGAIRNHEMVDSALMVAGILGLPIVCFGFHPNIKQSAGTAECLTYAKKRAIPAFVIRR